MSGSDVLKTAAAGMDAEAAALEVAARNVAAAQATAGPEGFARLLPRFGVSGDGEVRYEGTRAERGSQPDAVTEMVAVLNAQRAFEADASVFDIGKRFAERTIDAGRIS